MNFKFSLIAAMSLAGAFSLPANAALFATPSRFGAVVEGFEGFDGLVTTGPELLGGGVSVTSSIDSTLGAFAADLGTNGTWGAGNRFAGIGDLFLGGSDYDGSMTFGFGPAFGAGAKFSIFQGAGGTASITLEALDAANNVLESHGFVIAFDDPDALNEGLFFGIGRGSADIAALRVSGDGFVLDDLRVTPAPVPVPAAVWLLGSALAGIAGIARPRKA